MYSKAKLAGHPIHPMLVGFPIALYTATAVTLIVFAVTRDPFWYRVGMYAASAGVVMAAVALVPGAIDLFAIPARSRTRTVAYQHAGANVFAVVLFATAAGLLWGGWERGDAPLAVAAPLALSAIGLAAVGVAGYFGWSLVQDHHVGVQARPIDYDDRSRRRLADPDAIPPRTIRHTDLGRPAPTTWH